MSVGPGALIGFDLCAEGSTENTTDPRRRDLRENMAMLQSGGTPAGSAGGDTPVRGAGGSQLPHIRRTSLGILGRAVLFKEVLVITNGQEGHWAGRLAEQQANDFLRGLALRSPDGWTIALRIEVVLETEEPVSIWAVEDADKVHLLREICLRELLRVASDTKSLAPQRLEAHRVAELLNGSALDPPRFDPTAREFFDKFGHLLRPPSKSSSQSDQGRKR